jgi:hypothetical protein
MRAVSVWDNYSGAVSLPPGTPNIEIRPTPTGACVVINSTLPPVCTGTYRECHRYVQNNYRLTSTQMIPVYAAYEALLPKAPEAAEGGREQPTPPEVQTPTSPNKYRKPGK